MYCSKCGQQLVEDAVVCLGCGKQVSAVQDGNRRWPVFWLLIVLTILFPVLGVILGIIGLVQGRLGSATLLIMGLIMWLFWIIVLI